MPTICENLVKSVFQRTLTKFIVPPMFLVTSVSSRKPFGTMLTETVFDKYAVLGQIPEGFIIPYNVFNNKVLKPDCDHQGFVRIVDQQSFGQIFYHQIWFNCLLFTHGFLARYFSSTCLSKKLPTKAC